MFDSDLRLPAALQSGASLPVSAWDAKSRCEEAKNERLRALSSTVERKDVTFVCLPDTVDPRGPKGK